MTRMIQVQLFMLTIIVGFLAGPRVIGMFQGVSPAVGAGSVATVSAADPVDGKVSESTAPRTATDPYAQLSLTAKSVYVWDIATHRKLYGINDYERLPLASVTKMMMALVATELLTPETTITIAPIDLMQEGDTGLYVGEQWKFSDLLKFTLVASSNDGASAIARVAGATLAPNASSTTPANNKALFISAMNDKARIMGLANTHYSSESGLDIDSVTSGAYGTTRDMAMLFEYVLRKHPEIYSATSRPDISVTSLSGIEHHVANTNSGVASITGLIGSKTGYTDLAGGNLVVIVDVGIDHPIAIAVLGSTRDGRFTDVDKLISATVARITGDIAFR